jgi:hypothetical protein
VQHLDFSAAELLLCQIRDGGFAFYVERLVIGGRERNLNPDEPSEISDIGSHGSETSAALPVTVIGSSGINE